jgi:hypothetical protein
MEPTCNSTLTARANSDLCAGYHVPGRDPEKCRRLIDLHQRPRRGPASIPRDDRSGIPPPVATSRYNQSDRAVPPSERMFRLPPQRADATACTYRPHAPAAGIPDLAVSYHPISQSTAGGPWSQRASAFWIWSVRKPTLDPEQFARHLRQPPGIDRSQVGQDTTTWRLFAAPDLDRSLRYCGVRRPANFFFLR